MPAITESTKRKTFRIEAVQTGILWGGFPTLGVSLRHQVRGKPEGKPANAGRGGGDQALPALYASLPLHPKPERICQQPSRQLPRLAPQHPRSRSSHV